MKPLGIDLGTIGAEVPTLSAAPDCPGARLRVTRYDLATLTAGGERFVAGGPPIPNDGYGDARVRCVQTVERIAKTSSNDTLYYGLCHSCSDLEKRNREDLHERARVKGDR